MKFDIDETGLAVWLSVMAKIIPSNKQELPINRSVIFSKHDDGLYISCGHMQAILNVGPVVGDDIPDSMDPFAVDALSLYHMVRFQDKELVVGPDYTKRTVLVIAGESSVELDMVDIDFDLSVSGDMEPVAEYSLSKLNSALVDAQPFLSKDSSRPYLMGVYLTGNNMYAGDLDAATKTELQNMEFPVAGLNFVPDILIHILSLATAEQDVSIYFNDEWIQFAAPPFKLYLRRFTEVYNVQTVDEYFKLARQGTRSVSIDVASLARALDRVSFFCDRNGFVALRVQKSDPCLYAISGRSLKAKTALTAITTYSKDVYIGVLARHLKALVERVDGGHLELFFDDAGMEKGIQDIDVVMHSLYIPDEENNFQCWVVPLDLA